jgi:malonyl CoA-acyl carrier protein transacylase/acyl carrier protein/SAM-dependent methyltransferase
MPVGSVKGLIGHTECTSGVVALIRVLLMLHYETVPPQASFTRASPRLNASPTDMLEIRTRKTTWSGKSRTALINNYGASGSNASLIVSESPSLNNNVLAITDSSGTSHPFWITGLDKRSIQDYVTRLRSFLAVRPDLALSNLSFNMYRQSNRTLPQGFIFSVNSISDLEAKLGACADGKDSFASTSKLPSRPVILCFGGQTSKHIGLDESFYDSMGVFRAHLDRCNSILQKLGYANFYPKIFAKTNIDDPVQLQNMLFAVQYSCAQSWIDCGIEPVAVVGHSFGELTALCVAGVLPLKEALLVVAARAKLIKSSWGPDSGAMMAVEGDLTQLQDLLGSITTTNPGEVRATVACYNGPTSFTCAGSTSAIDELERGISITPGLRGKKLSVTNAFHSALVDPLMAKLKEVASDIKFSEPTVRWERATENHSSSIIGPEFLASHMREPVFANHAFQRLNQDFPSAIWLEAGSNSTITRMASKALKTPVASCFLDFNITSGSGLQKLTDTFITLWNEGLTIPHWAHHHSQAHLYSPILLPPYQFEKSRHWLQLKKPVQAVDEEGSRPNILAKQLPVELYTFVNYQDAAKSAARFRINTTSERYIEFVSGHLIVQTAAICPATLEVDIVIEALFSLRPELKAPGLQPEIKDVSNQAPICNDSSRMVWLDLQVSVTDIHAWSWQISSTNGEGASKVTHVKGQIVLRSVEDQTDFARYERLISHQACVDLLQDSDPDDVLQGRNLYKVFSEIVDYSEPYRGLQKLVGKGNISAGRVVKAHSGRTWLDPHLSDCFSQVGGFWVNCMTDRMPSDMYIAAGFESWFRKPGSMVPLQEAEQPSVWDVMAYHKRTSEKAFTSDIFIFDAANGMLHEVILGINYARITKAIMSKTLTKLTASTTTATETVPLKMQSTLAPSNVQPIAPSTTDTIALAQAATPKVVPEHKSQAVDAVIEILAELAGIEVDVIKLSTRLTDIGIDSLVGMEMVHDLEAKFECSLDMDQMAEVVTVHNVVQCVHAALGIESDNGSSELGTSSPSGTQSPISEHSSATSTSSSEGIDSKQAIEELQISPSVLLDAFGNVKKLTDQFITDFGCSGYMDTINPKQTQLCLALVVEAFEKLGCNLRTAKAGQRLPKIDYAPQHGRLAQYLYTLLETEGRLINVEGDLMVRTAVSLPRSSKDLLATLESSFPAHGCANRLAFFCGSRLVEVLEGKLDGVKLIFGNEEGRQLVSGLYGDTLLNKIFYNLMEETLTHLISRLPRGSGPLRILEMGAGTGGTTKYLVPLLAKLDFPVEYTFTDLAPSFVAAARRKFKDYPFMKFRAHDIEQLPADDLVGTQHIVIASNAVHATHSLAVSLKNIRKALRPDGFLMMLEMTQTLPWVDIIFGILEGWWLFDDGRTHAIAHQSSWERELHAQGYGHVDWTDGQLPENDIQRIIIAMASGQK